MGRTRSAGRKYEDFIANNGSNERLLVEHNSLVNTSSWRNPQQLIKLILNI